MSTQIMCVTTWLIQHVRSYMRAIPIFDNFWKFPVFYLILYFLHNNTVIWHIDMFSLHFDTIYRKMYYIRESEIASIHTHPLYRRNYSVGVIICLYMYFYFIKNLLYLTYTAGYKVKSLIATKYVLRHQKKVTIMKPKNVYLYSFW